MSLRITTVFFAFMMAIGMLTGLRFSHAELTTTAPTTNATGVISQISGDRITLQASGHTMSFAMPHGTPVKISGQPATTADLKVGMSAIVITTDGKTASEIRAYPPTTTKPTTKPTTEPSTKPTSKPATQPANHSYTGVISQVSGDAITLQASGKTTTFTITPSTTIRIGDHTVTVADLKVGMYAQVVSTDGKTAVEIHAYQPTTTKPTTKPTTEPTTKPTTKPATQPANHNLTGVISQVSGDGITLQSSGKTTTFTITSSTTIKVGDHAATVADLKVGMYAQVVSTDGKTAVEIHGYLPTTTKPATQPTTKPVTTNTFTGTITQVRGDGISLESPPHSASFAFNSATKITVNGQPATGADLKVGMKAGVTSTDGKVATEIRAYAVTTTPAK